MKDEDLDAQLRGLSAQLPAALVARVHAQARATFERRSAVGRAGRIATAAAVVSAVAIYLAWAVEFLNALARS